MTANIKICKKYAINNKIVEDILTFDKCDIIYSTPTPHSVFQEPIFNIISNMQNHTFFIHDKQMYYHVFNSTEKLSFDYVQEIYCFKHPNLVQKIIDISFNITDNVYTKPSFTNFIQWCAKNNIRTNISVEKIR